MARYVLDETQIHPAAREKVSSNERGIVEEVLTAMRDHAVVVVGMAQNPFPRKVRKLLHGAGIAHKYLEYGSYLSMWRRRNALKMWTGWPTFPMVFVGGVFVGGFAETEKLLASGELKRMLAPRPAATSSLLN